VNTTITIGDELWFKVTEVDLTEKRSRFRLDARRKAFWAACGLREGLTEARRAGNGEHVRVAT
jgi:hypothetical protein